MSDDANQFVEYLIVGGILDDMLAAGFSISVSDGDEMVIQRSTDKAAILAVMHSTDEDHIYCHGMPHNPPEGFKLYAGRGDTAGMIRLIYGNEGAYVLNDHGEQLEHWLDANDSQYQRWFRYIDDFKWGTPSPMDSKMATMRNLLDAHAEIAKDAVEVAKKAEQAACDLWHGLDENNKAWLEMPQGARDAHPDRYISDMLKQNKDVLYEHKAYKPDHELQPEPGYGPKDFLAIFKAGRERRHTGVTSPYGPQSVDLQIDVMGWVYEDLRLGLAKHRPAYRRLQEHNDPQFAETMTKWEAAGKPVNE